MISLPVAIRLIQSCAIAVSVFQEPGRSSNSPMAMVRIKHILFDMDGVLYPASNGLLDEINRRISRFIASCWNVEQDEADTIRRQFLNAYGSTLKGLAATKQDAFIEKFLREVHPSDVSSFISEDKELQNLLNTLPCSASLFTNAPIEYVKAVTDALGVNRKVFKNISDLRSRDFCVKPESQSYADILKVCESNPEETLFIDDSITNLNGFASMGGHCVYVDESAEKESQYPSIRRITELPSLYPSLFTGKGVTVTRL